MITNNPAHPHISDRDDMSGLWDHTIQEFDKFVSGEGFQEHYHKEREHLDALLALTCGGLAQRLTANPEGVGIVLAAAAYGLIHRAQLLDKVKRGEKEVVE